MSFCRPQPIEIPSMNQPSELPLVALLGPTASGKSTLAVWLAEHCDGEVVACDSTQLYRGFDIGTAKPTAEERRGVPHHLLDVLEVGEWTTAGAYRERAATVLEDLAKRGKLPIFTVGTGLYLRALVEGLAEVPERSEELRLRLRSSAAEHPAGYLHRMLRRLDRVSAEKIEPTDQQKLIRAIEVCLLAKKPLSELHQSPRKHLQGWRVLKIGLLPERERLYERLRMRTDSMLERGWMEEVRGWIELGLSEPSKPYDFIGYRELRAVLEGKGKLAEARLAILQATRRYAKRQFTWFRREPGVLWLAGFGEETLIQEQALQRVKAFVHGTGLPGRNGMEV